MLTKCEVHGLYSKEAHPAGCPDCNTYRAIAGVLGVSSDDESFARHRKAMLEQAESALASPSIVAGTVMGGVR